MQDFRGEELTGGDLVAYARRMGSALWLEQGYVTFGQGPFTGKLKVRNTKTNRVVTISNLTNVIKLAPATVPLSLSSSQPESVQPSL